MPKIQERAKSILKLRKDVRHLFWTLNNIVEVVCFSANVRKCNIANSLWLGLGGSLGKLTNVHQLLTIMFKNILRTFQPELLKIFSKIQP